MSILCDFDKINCPDSMAPQRPEDGKETEKETEVTNTVHNKRFLRGITGTLLFEVVADQQVGAETDTFPTDKHDQCVVTEHQHEHGENEEVQVTEVTVETFFTMHVTDGVEMNQGTHTRDNHDHQGRERIEQEAPVHLQVANRHPGCNNILVRLDGIAKQLDKVLAGDQERKEQHTSTNRTDQLFVLDEPLAKQPVNN